MKKLLFLIVTSSVLFSHGQTSFQKGYIIDNNNKKFHCYIENKDLVRSPEHIDYKLTENSEIKTLSIDQLKAFRIYETNQFYKRYSISKNLVGENFDALEIDINIVLLKVLVDGNADLLEYYNDSKYYYFYEKEENLFYLEYKMYVDENNKIRENEMFKKQLFENFKCDDFILEDYSNMRYNNTYLSKFFSEYNRCIGEDYLNLHEQRTKAKFNFKVRGGVNLITSQTSGDYLISYEIPQGAVEINKSIGNVENYDTKMNFSLGVELELRLPYNNNNWGVFLSPNYQSLSGLRGTKSFSEPNDPEVLDIIIKSNLSYSFIQIPAGIRRYFDVNDSMEIYTHLAYTQNIVLSSSDKIETDIINDSTTFFDVNEKLANRGRQNNAGIYFGFGVNFLDKYALEVNYFSTNINLKSQSNVSQRGFSLNASYTLF